MREHKNRDLTPALLKLNQKTVSQPVLDKGLSEQQMFPDSHNKYQFKKEKRIEFKAVKELIIEQLYKDLNI